MKKKQKNSETLLLTLCAACARQFYNSPEHIVRRVNKNQKIKEPCMYCSNGYGWDYYVSRKKGGHLL